jgi:hypothetical protein
VLEQHWACPIVSQPAPVLPHVDRHSFKTQLNPAQHGVSSSHGSSALRHPDSHVPSVVAAPSGLQPRPTQQSLLCWQR